jgi:hypothetical protein
MNAKIPVAFLCSLIFVRMLFCLYSIETLQSDADSQGLSLLYHPNEYVFINMFSFNRSRVNIITDIQHYRQNSIKPILDKLTKYYIIDCISITGDVFNQSDIPKTIEINKEVIPVYISLK